MSSRASRRLAGGQSTTLASKNLTPSREDAKVDREGVVYIR